MVGWLKSLGRWFDVRLGIGETLMPMLRHPVPRALEGPMGWWYVFGSASLTFLMIQIVTGICLSLVYVPSAEEAYESLLYLDYQHPWGWFLRALHYYAGSGMVVMVFVHMTQVFLQGAYKYPRELTWLVGVLLLACTLGMFFSGQILRWDPDAYWGLAVAGSMAGRVPGAGPEVVRLLLGSDIIGAAALSRFFALHVFVIPGRCWRCWPCTFGWCCGAASARRRCPGKWLTPRHTTPSITKNSSAAFPFWATPCYVTFSSPRLR